MSRESVKFTKDLNFMKNEEQKEFSSAKNPAKFDVHGWIELLKVQPQFADKCSEYNGWEKFNGSPWAKLLKAQPQFADKAKEYR